MLPHPVILMDTHTMTPAEVRRLDQPHDALAILVNDPVAAPPVMAPVADNAPENIYARVMDGDGIIVATIYKKGIVATSNELSSKLADYFATHDSPQDRADALAKAVDGKVLYPDASQP